MYPMPTMSPLGTTRRSAVVPAWLAGGISAANCLAAYQPKGAASLAASYTNLANPGTYTVNPLVAPTWDITNGWKSVTGTRMDSGIIPASGYSIVVRFTNVGVSDYMIVGCWSPLNNKFGIAPNRATVGVQYSSGQQRTVTPGLSAGILSVSGQKGYRNGVIDVTPIGAWTAAATLTIFLGVMNAATIIGTAGNYIQACYIYNRELTAAENLAVYTAMAAL